MKLKKTITALVVFIIASAIMLAVLGCSNPAGGGISYTGTYAGVGEEDSGLGAWEFTIDAKGNLTGWFQVLTSAQSNCSGTIKSDGSFTASGKTVLAYLPFTGVFDGKTSVHTMHNFLYPFVAPRLSYVCRRVRKHLKLIYYGAVFVWKTFKVFGFKNGCTCARVVIKDIYNL